MKNIQHPRSIMFTVPLILLLMVTPALSQTPDEFRQSQQAERDAIKAYRSRDFPQFLENMKTASDLRQNHSRLLYNLAVAYVLNGQDEDALDVLDRLAKMGLSFSLDKDEDLRRLFENDKFRSIKAKMERNRLPLGISRRAFSIPNKKLIAEGIAFDSKTKTFYVGSIHLRKIIAVDDNGRTKEFSNETDGLWSVSGMRVDSKRRILWVCSSALPQMEGFGKADGGRSGIFKYDLRTGRLLKKYLLSNESEKHVLGDLVLNRNGDVFASDSVSPYIYWIDSKTGQFEVLLRSDYFSSLQGLALTDDGNTMFAADYSKGIFKIDLHSRKITQMNPGAYVTLLGIDGLYFHKGRLVAIQNGITPNRVISLKMDRSASEITGYETLETNHPDFNEPTLGVLVGNEFYYVANSQWELVNENAGLKTDLLQNPLILKVILP